MLAPNPSCSHKQQTGFVLPLVLVLVLVTGILSVGALNDAGQQERQGGIFVRQSQIFELAEAQLRKIEEDLLLQGSLENLGHGNTKSCGVLESKNELNGLLLLDRNLDDDQSDCQEVRWSHWLNEKCSDSSQLGSLQADIDIPSNWSVCAVIWNFSRVGFDPNYGNVEHPGTLANFPPIERYLISLRIAAPEQAGGGQVVLQSLLNGDG